MHGAFLPSPSPAVLASLFPSPALVFSGVPHLSAGTGSRHPSHLARLVDHYLGGTENNHTTLSQAARSRPPSINFVSPEATPFLTSRLNGSQPRDLAPRRHPDGPTDIDRHSFQESDSVEGEPEMLRASMAYRCGTEILATLTSGESIQSIRLAIRNPGYVEDFYLG